MTKWVYSFSMGKSEGNAGVKALLGGKGANLAEISQLGIPVPPGFTLTTEVYAYYNACSNTYPPLLYEQVDAAIKEVGQCVGAQFGDPANPLLVSVRSGACVSMPGMMETVLNLGLNDQTVEVFAEKINDQRCAYDSYRRFIQMYSNVVLDIEHDCFEDILDTYKRGLGISLDTQMTAQNWKDIVNLFKACVIDCTDRSFPQDVWEQLWSTIGSVFSSWMNKRAITYRQLNDIPDSLGTAVNVQAMVFGNMGDTSATGVTFTRDPATGEKIFYGEFLINAQGEDVVAGLRTPQNISEDARLSAGSDHPSMEMLMPRVFDELVTISQILEGHYHDMQDLEFTVQNGRLWILQTRSGKRCGQAAVKIAVDMVHEGLIDREEALLRITPELLNQLLHPTLNTDVPRNVLTTGLPASPGAAVGEIVFSACDAQLQNEKGKSVILVRTETSPDDIHGMHTAAGILTMRGGMTSHAAVVARGMGRPCISGASALEIDYEKRTLTISGVTLKQGDVITIDGDTGQVLRGSLDMCRSELSRDFITLMGWADEIRKLGVRANADTLQDARIARELGAEGIGLCRTEHMFFSEDRILVMREMILANSEARRHKALMKLLPMQRSDFESLFDIMLGQPVTIRLLDPPLHEFLPHDKNEIIEVARQLGYSTEELSKRINDLSEFNPMLGHRGCRLAITYPVIAEIQIRAILEAAVCISEKRGIVVEPEIMIPLICGRAEFDFLAAYIRKVAEDVRRETKVNFSYKIGTMIELPRACLQAGAIAESAEFFSFGTNDLTQTCMGISRDDAGNFLSHYVEKKLLVANPFVSIDEEGVGELMRIAVERGRKVRPDLQLGICGEHGGDLSSINFCHEINIDYVSCSPFRVPIARLSAAQVAILSSRRQ